MPEPALVIGVGNPYRHDDGFGVAVLERLRELAVPGLQIVEESGEPAALIARWSGQSVVIMVDAVTSGAAPGSIHRLECGNGVWDLGDRAASASTHGLGVADAVELAKVLDQLPARLVIIGVETEDVTNGTGLSNAVAAAVDPVAIAIAEISTGASGKPANTITSGNSTTSSGAAAASSATQVNMPTGPAASENTASPAAGSDPADRATASCPTATEFCRATLARTGSGLGSA